MPILRRSKVIFIHIPKTGGSSVGSAVGMYDSQSNSSMSEHMVLPESAEGGAPNRVPEGHYTSQHFTAAMIRAEVPNYDRCYKFTFVRDPYTRMLSAYYYRTGNGLKEYTDFDPGTFHEWVSHLLGGPEDVFRYPQASFVDDTVDFVGRFENLETDLRKVLDRLFRIRGMCGVLRSGMPHVRSSGLPKGPLVGMMLLKTRRMIEKFYGDDFSEFGYEKQ